MKKFRFYYIGFEEQLKFLNRVVIRSDFHGRNVNFGVSGDKEDEDKEARKEVITINSIGILRSEPNKVEG